MIVTKALIYSAGLATRMKGLTSNIPKAMLEVGGMKLIEYPINLFINCGIKDIYINTHYLAHIFENFIEYELREKYKDVNFHILYEEELLENGGTLLKLFKETKEEYFLTSNSDIYLNYDPKLIKNFFDELKPPFKGVLYLKEISKLPYKIRPDFMIQKTGEIKFDKITGTHIFTGIQILHNSLFDKQSEKKFSLPKIYEENIGVLRGIDFQPEWLPVGTYEEYNIVKNFIKL